MRHLFFTLTLLTTLSTATPALASEYNKSFGLVTGDLSGFSFKYWTKRGLIKGQQQAYDAAAGWRIGANSVDIQLKLDYVVHKKDLIPVDVGQVLVYYGMGMRVLAGADDHIGVRVPVGVNYLFQNEPFDAFLEIAPVMRVFPQTALDMSAAIGVRYRFN